VTPNWLEREGEEYEKNSWEMKGAREVEEK
jgi:hypothetical protein